MKIKLLKLPLRTSSRKEWRESSESDLRTERDRQEVSAVTAAREADSIFSLAVWNACSDRDCSLSLLCNDTDKSFINSGLYVVKTSNLTNYLSAQWCPQPIQELCQVFTFISSNASSLKKRNKAQSEVQLQILKTISPTYTWFEAFFFHQLREEFSPESVASLALHSGHPSPAFRWWVVTKTAENTNVSVKRKKNAAIPKGQRGTNEWRLGPNLSKLRRPNKDVSQGHDQFLSGDAMGVVRRLGQAIQRRE